MAFDSTLKRHDNLMPQRPSGIGKGTALALVVHAGLLIALAFGVAWRSQTPAGVSAELWAAVPQVAAPPPAAEPKPTPTPTPPQPAPPQPTPPKVEEPPKPTQAQIDAQIAIEKEKTERKQREQREREQQLREQQQREQERKEKEQKERLEREKAEKLAAQKQRELDAKRQKEEEARQAKVREDNLKRMLSQAGTGSPDSPGTAAREAGPSASYAGRIIARVKPNIVLTEEVPGNPAAVVELRCAADGTITGRRLVKSSGSKAWDETVLRAIDRTEVLPRDVDGRVPPSVEITFRPRDM